MVGDQTEWRSTHCTRPALRLPTGLQTMAPASTAPPKSTSATEAGKRQDPAAGFSFSIGEISAATRSRTSRQANIVGTASSNRLTQAEKK